MTLPSRFLLWSRFAGLAVALFAAVSLATEAQAQALLRDGTSVLVKRVLADGTVLVPPAVQGRSTTKDGVNQLLVLWPTPDGKQASISMLSQWSQTANDITAKVNVMIFDDGSGKPPVYDLSERSATSPVTRSGGKARYQHPLNAPVIETDGDRTKATVDGVFTDYWERLR